MNVSFRDVQTTQHIEYAAKCIVHYMENYISRPPAEKNGHNYQTETDALALYRVWKTAGGGLVVRRYVQK